MIDRELYDVDSLLTESKRGRFAAKGVVGANDAVRLSEQWIKTSGWIPVDARVHVTDVSSLVSHLGGAQLYGKNPSVPLRELIQNAADAIRARRILRQKEGFTGKITVRTGQDSSGLWVEVEDNGTGMSERLLTRHLLDFGSSYWNSEDMRRDHPGLAASQFNPTGRFGIGFFSVFMWGSRVRVVSRPDREAEPTKILEFEGGLGKRPLVRPAQIDEQKFECGTRVRVWLSSKETWKALLQDDSRQANSSDGRSLAAVVARVAPALDISIDVESTEGEKIQAVQANDWISIDASALLKRLGSDNIELLAPKLRHIYAPDGRCVGRACVSGWNGRNGRGSVTVGGLHASYKDDFSGIICGSTTVAARNDASPDASLDALSAWASDQAVIWGSAAPHEELHDIGANVVCFAGESGDLPVVWLKGSRAASSELMQHAKDRDEVSVAKAIDRVYAKNEDIVISDMDYFYRRSAPLGEWPPLFKIAHWISMAWDQEEEFNKGTSKWLSTHSVRSERGSSNEHVVTWTFRRNT
jgi:hypothetical protein